MPRLTPPASASGSPWWRGSPSSTAARHGSRTARGAAPPSRCSCPAALTERSALLHRRPHQGPVLGPAPVVVLHARVPQQLGQGEPGVGGTLTDPAVGDDLTLLGDPGTFVQRGELLG